MEPHSELKPVPSPSPSSTPEPSPASGVPLGETLRRGWDWVVFVWQTGRRLGGPGEVFRTIFTVLSLLIRRTLTQWGLLKR
ncbi:MAG: hypothetical protein SFW36_01840 [Leptolyngbyaceae cyanobacterium bins.59]|nr:hypothetical protein [Leptolyngbyaceae cyanobacterium bins.59]